jgi:hypothetical protein
MADTFATEHCSHCGAPLLVRIYHAADGDLLFAGAVEVREGNGVMQKRAALLCRYCDRTDAMPEVR